MSPEVQAKELNSLRNMAGRLDSIIDSLSQKKNDQAARVSAHYLRQTVASLRYAIDVVAGVVPPKDYAGGNFPS